MKKITTLLNVLLVIGFAIGVYYMFLSTNNGAVLTANGLANLKYFTVLSNVLCGIVAIVSLVRTLLKKAPVSIVWKFVAATEVAVTFAIVAFFLQPMYPDLNMFERGNLYFHLICPLLAMAEFILLSLNEKKIPMKAVLITGIATAAYATFYLANVLVNGMGEWPDTNDFYGFLNWGYPIGMVIFAMSIVVTWGLALLLRVPNVVKNRKQNRMQQA